MLPILADDYDEAKAIFPQRIGPEQLALCGGHRVSIDTETNGLYWYHNNMIGVGVWCPDAEIYGYMPTQRQDTQRLAIEAIRSWPADTVVIGHNLKFDCHMLGLDPAAWKTILDTTVMVHLLDSRSSKALVNVEQEQLGSSSKRQHLTKAPAGLQIWDWPIATIADYCTNDAKVTYQLVETLIPKLRELDLLKLLKKEMRYLKLLWRIERRGLLIDDDFIEESMAQLDHDSAQAQVELFKAIGYEFNWRSVQKLSKALYDDYGWDRPVDPFAGADGKYHGKLGHHRLKYNSTLTDSLILMTKAKHPLAELVLHLREIDKLKNNLREYRKYRGRDGAVHSSFNQNGTRTARLSSSDPNLQNIPSEIRSRSVTAVYEAGAQLRKEAYNLRTGLVARPDHIFVSIDYKQMEMRMFGLLAQEPHMLESLRSGKDIHKENAVMVWGDGDDIHREWSKVIGFGLIYGMTIGSLQFRLNVTKERAYEITDQYWGAFPRIKPWLQEVARECKSRGYVRYWSGRIWREDVELFMYKAANAKIQGGCADLLSIAAMRSDDYLREHRCGHIVNLVHDEILFELGLAGWQEHARALAKIMEVPDLLDLAFFTDIKAGPDFGNLVKFK